MGGRQRQEQAQMMANQDEQLTELSKTAARLGDTARVINTELQDQQRMLDELGDDIDKETEKLNFVMKRVGRLIKTSDNKQICIIMALFALACLLDNQHLNLALCARQHERVHEACSGRARPRCI